jgi:hypothetical protein
MTGTPTPAEQLQPGQRIRIEPHKVHGIDAGYLPDKAHAGSAEADAQIDSVTPVEGCECDVSVLCHPCYLGGSADVRWATTYHRTDVVPVLAGAPGVAA